MVKKPRKGIYFNLSTAKTRALMGLGIGIGMILNFLAFLVNPRKGIRELKANRKIHTELRERKRRHQQ